MLNDGTLKALIEAIIYVAPEPVTLDAIVKSLEGEERERVKARLQELMNDYERAEHGIQIRRVAGGQQIYPQPEGHQGPRQVAERFEPPLRASKTAAAD